MTDDSIELTRRKILASAGAVGLAGAGAGMGTSALFSDEEEFENNTLTAGQLDLTVDWEEHYWDDIDLEDLAVDLVESADDVGEDQVGLPDPQNPMLAVDENNLGAFMDATGIEAFPDSDDDGVQDDLEEYDACQDFAQTPGGLDPAGLRSDNEDTQAEEGWAPLVDLQDVKPGDFGELTLSFHLCDNPGYVWLNGELVDASENGVTEPEGRSEAEEDGTVELLDEVETLLWYDEDGDNVFEPGGETGDEVEVVLVLDRSGSMGSGEDSKLEAQETAAKNLVDALNLGSDAARVGVVSFADQESLDQELTTDPSAAKGAIEGITSGGSTNLEGGVNGGEDVLTGSDFSEEVDPTVNPRSGADKIMVALSDGNANVDDNEVGGSDGNDDPTDEATRAKGNGVEMYTIALGSGADTSTLEDMASSPKSNHFYQGSAGGLTQIFAQISQQIAGEEAFFRGSLRELLDAAASGDGIPLDGDRATAFDETGDPDDDPDRDAFVDSTNNFVGLAWWVPRSVGNQIQSDTVSFDLGFYTEQARNNDGSGTA